ncbi:MAG: hypothetical protein AAGA55_02815 [Planctomycetota bacterium]
MQRLTSVALTVACVAQASHAQLLDFESTATLDRWMYPFNGSPGTRFAGPTFGAPRLTGFDDHDAQVILGFSTVESIPDGLDPSDYRVTSVKVYTTSLGSDRFRFDPSYDDANTYGNLDTGLPGPVADSDDGRPVMLFGVGYRDEFDATSWNETSPFGFNASVPPAQESRVAFAATFDAGGVATDISNSLKLNFDPIPFAIGQTDAVLPGEFVPTDSEFSFTVDLCDPGTKAYLAESLALGELRFAVTSLHNATFDPDGGGAGDPTYPDWYMRENALGDILGFTPRVEVTVFVGPIGDYNGDGNRNFFDISDYIADFNAQEPLADITGDCLFNFFDISAFITAFNTP